VSCAAEVLTRRGHRAARAHSETVPRGFYAFHLDEGSGPLTNPFPLDRSRRDRRAHAHHNPMEPHRDERTGLYRPTVPTRLPGSVPDGQCSQRAVFPTSSVPDEEFNEIDPRRAKVLT
jgi:hypothetical protein